MLKNSTKEAVCGALAFIVSFLNQSKENCDFLYDCSKFGVTFCLAGY